LFDITGGDDGLLVKELVKEKGILSAPDHQPGKILPKETVHRAKKLSDRDNYY
jgi:hypothetical protein